MNSGALLHIIAVRFDQCLSPELPRIRHAVEFEFNGNRYYASLDRLHENTSLEESLPAGLGTSTA